jgi:hypothetical protein
MRKSCKRQISFVNSVNSVYIESVLEFVVVRHIVDSQLRDAGIARKSVENRSLNNPNPLRICRECVYVDRLLVGASLWQLLERGGHTQSTQESRVHPAPLLKKMSTGMFTFQGDYKRRAQVNLGRTTHEDRASLLKKAQDERKAREEKRRREIAAMKIQVSIPL